MNIEQLTLKAMDIRRKYSVLGTETFGRGWSTQEIAQGFVGDVGDLTKLVMAKEGIREIDGVDKKLEHELSDCLWSILVLAHEYNVDLEKAFTETMAELDTRFN